MSYESIKLSDAIIATQNGLKSLSNEQNNYRNKEAEFKIKADDLEIEIRARRELLNAMIKLQNVLGTEDTIKFIVPNL